MSGAGLSPTGAGLSRLDEVRGSLAAVCGGGGVRGVLVIFRRRNTSEKCHVNVNGKARRNLNASDAVLLPRDGRETVLRRARSEG